MTVNERMRELRIALGLSQSDFAKAIRVSQSTVSWGEKPGNNVKASTVHAAASEFGASEVWILEGTGPMFLAERKPSEVEALCGRLLAGEADPFRTALAAALAKLDDNQCAALADFAVKLADEIREEKARREAERAASAEETARAKAEEAAAETYRMVYDQTLLSQKAEDGSGACRSGDSKAG